MKTPFLYGKGVESYSVRGAAIDGAEVARKPAGKTTIHDAIWRAHGLPIPEVEFRFHPVRRWRFDYAWADLKVALEVNGGIFSMGGHVRGGHLKGEYEKLNEAQLLGWKVLIVIPDWIKDGSAFELVKRALT